MIDDEMWRMQVKVRNANAAIMPMVTSEIVENDSDVQQKEAPEELFNQCGAGYASCSQRHAGTMDGDKLQNKAHWGNIDAWCIKRQRGGLWGYTFSIPTTNFARCSNTFPRHQTPCHATLILSSKQRPCIQLVDLRFASPRSPETQLSLLRKPLNSLFSPLIISPSLLETDLTPDLVR